MNAMTYQRGSVQDLIQRKVIVKASSGKTYPAITQDFTEPKVGQRIFCRISIRNNFLNDFAVVVSIAD